MRSFERIAVITEGDMIQIEIAAKQEIKQSTAGSMN